MRIRPLLLAALVLVALAAAGSPSGAGVRLPRLFEFEPELDCVQPEGPAAVGVPVAVEPLGLGANVDLDVYVLLEGVEATVAGQIFAAAAQSYAPHGITLKAGGYEAVSFTGDDVTPLNPASLMAQAKSHMGGARPAGYDVVFLLTSKDIGIDLEVLPGEHVREYAILGVADCIGGIRYPTRAFAVGEIEEAGFPFLGLQWFPTTTSLIVAHEVGHLMGAQHHYANCVEGAPHSAENSSVTPCDLMFNSAEFNSPNFGVLNSVVVRGHAEEWATP